MQKAKAKLSLAHYKAQDVLISSLFLYFIWKHNISSYNGIKYFVLCLCLRDFVPVSFFLVYVFCSCLSCTYSIGPQSLLFLESNFTEIKRNRSKIKGNNRPPKSKNHFHYLAKTLRALLQFVFQWCWTSVALETSPESFVWGSMMFYEENI